MEFNIADFEKNKNYVIEASAGTGKTYSIVQIINKLTLDFDIPLNKILIVTYTEKAAGELKNRIRELVKTNEKISNEDVDNATIGTIHSFCQNILKEFFISSDKPCEQKNIGKNNVRDFLMQYIRHGEIYEEICEFKNYDDNISNQIEENLVSRFAEIIDKYYLNSNFSVDESIVSFTEKDCKTYGSFDLTNLNKENIKKNFENYLLLKYVNDIYLKWQQHKSVLCEQTFNDMIRDVREAAVNNSDLLKQIKEKYRYVIIDEFQDTNQKQWDIFKNAFLCNDHNIIVVGDPKQSIYSFQGADVTVYEKAKSEICEKKGEVRVLNKNYRATKEIIHSTNLFFDNKNTYALNEDFKYSMLGKEKFKAEYNGIETEAFWITDEKITINEYARIVCQTIADFCTKTESNKTKLVVYDDGNERNVSFKDFAVLGRTHDELGPIMNALKKCGIPFVKHKDESLFSGKECAHWISLLDAIDTPDFVGENRIKFRKAMITSFFGYSLDDIRSSEFDKDSIKEIALFEEWKSIAKNRNWEELIESIIIDTDIQNRLQSLSNLKSLGAFLQIGDYCVEYLSKCNNLKMLIKNLISKKKCKSDDEDEKDANLIGKRSDFDCVNLMTIHASKGLEFPVVFSVAGFKGRKKNNGTVFNYHIENKNILSFDVIEENTEIDNEIKRLIYVDYTRAKYILVIPHFKRAVLAGYISNAIGEYKKSNPFKLLTDNGNDYNDKKKDVNKILSQNDVYKPKDTITQDERINELKKFSKKMSSFNSYKHAYSSLSHGHSEIETITDDVLKADNSEDSEVSPLCAYDKSAKQIECEYNDRLEPLTLSEKFPVGAGLGNAIHEVFELIDYTATADIDDEFIRGCFEKQKMNFREEWLNDTQNIINSVVSAELPVIKGNKRISESFMLKDISFNDRKNEIEFNFNKENEVFKNYFNGFIDLVFRRGEYYSILDWKSDRLNEDFASYSDKTELKNRVDNTYSIQRVLYSYCLIKWLKQFYKGKSEEEIFTEHFGGIYYIFIRGCNEGTGNGVYAQTWEDFASLEKEYKKIVDERVDSK